MHFENARTDWLEINGYRLWVNIVWMLGFTYVTFPKLSEDCPPCLITAMNEKIQQILGEGYGLEDFNTINGDTGLEMQGIFKVG